MYDYFHSNTLYLTRPHKKADDHYFDMPHDNKEKHRMNTIHNDIIIWKCFLYYWSFLAETTGHMWIPFTKIL